MLHIKVKTAFTGTRNDHYKPRKRRPSPKQWRKMVASEFETAPKVIINGVTCAVRITGQAHLPYQILRPHADSFQVLDAWAKDDGTFDVREKMSKEVIAVLKSTEEGLQQVCSTEKAPCYDEVADRHRQIDTLLASDLPPVERESVIAERKVVQRQMSALSFQQLFDSGLAALEDGLPDYKLFSASQRIKTLERMLIGANLSPEARAIITDTSLPSARQAFTQRVMHLQRQGRITIKGGK